MSLIRKHVAVLQAWACLDLVCKVSSPFFLQLVFENSVNIFREPYSLNRDKFLISALSSSPNDVTSPVFRHCIKNYYLQKYRLLWFTNTEYMPKTKHKLIEVKK